MNAPAPLVGWDALVAMAARLSSEQVKRTSTDDARRGKAWALLQ